MSYTKFLESKQKKVIESGFEVQSLNENLFDFQEFIVKRALKAGKYAIFAGTGTGKTIMQLSWANQVTKHTNKPVLILAPLQLTVIQRAIQMWSNPGELVFTPFGGIASELYSALKLKRRAAGIELKSSYWDAGCRNINRVLEKRNELTLF